MSHVHGAHSGSGIQHHGHAHAFGHTKHAEQAQAKGKSGEKTAAGQAPAAQQPPSMDAAMQQLDAAIKGLAANFNKDSYNGAAAPEGVGGSKLENPLATLKNDTFAPVATAAPAPTAAAPAPTSPLADPILNVKGGGGGAAAGGVLESSYLNTLGGAGAAGGVLDLQTKAALFDKGGGGASGGVINTAG